MELPEADASTLLCSVRPGVSTHTSPMIQKLHEQCGHPHAFGITMVTPQCAPVCVCRYTSLGSTLDTIPNPALKQTGPAAKGKSKSEGGLSGHTHSSSAGAYLPAYMLTDETLERAGRNWYN